MAPMFASIVLRVLAFAAFAGFGIAWAATHGESLAIMWVVSFAAIVVLTVWDAIPQEDRAVLGSWERVPGFSKNPDDYR